MEMEEDEDNNDNTEDEVIVVEKKYSHTEAAAAMDLLKTYLLSHQFSTETHLSLNSSEHIAAQHSEGENKLSKEGTINFKFL